MQNALRLFTIQKYHLSHKIVLNNSVCVFLVQYIIVPTPTLLPAVCVQTLHVVHIAHIPVKEGFANITASSSMDPQL